MAAPRQMTAETLNALKGWGANLHAVDYSAKLDPTALSGTGLTRVAAGAVVHVDPTSKKFKLGVGTTNSMPMYLFNASDDPDVSNDGGDASTVKGVFIPISPSGAMMALVAVGAFELVSTYFVAASYTINQMLTSADSGANAGKLAAGTLGTNVICGMVSRATNSDGTVDNGYGTDAIAFWPVFFPVYP